MREAEIEAQWNEPANRHPHYADHDHPINFNIGKLSGGEWASSVATQCRAGLRIGFYPGIKPAQVRALIEAALKAAYEAHPKQASVRYEVIYHGFQAEGMLVDMNQPMIDTLKACHHEVAGGQMELPAPRPPMRASSSSTAAFPPPVMAHSRATRTASTSGCPSTA